MAGEIFCEWALPDDPFLDQFSSGYDRTDCYFRQREWFKIDKGRSSPPTLVFRVAKDGPVVGYCSFDFGKKPHPDDTSSSKARYLVIYMIGVDRAFQRTANPLSPSQTYAASMVSVLEDLARAKQNCVGLSPWVRSTNAVAISFYRKVGFTPDPGCPTQHDGGDPILTMRKILS